MTATRRTRTMRSSKASLAALLLAAALLFLIAPSLLADELHRTRHIIDSSTDRTPKLTAFPSYPRIARRDRIEGDATVCFRIDKYGRIRSARIQDVTHPIFKRAAMRAIRESSFEALKPNEVLATARTCRTYRFRLEPILVAGQQE